MKISFSSIFTRHPVESPRKLTGQNECSNKFIKFWVLEGEPLKSLYLSGMCETNETQVSVKK